ncbi:MAG: hydrogenase formation protein HypD [Phycisphaerae bacterium]|jgi:hydrogenase expression/formation protein HypD
MTPADTTRLDAARRAIAELAARVGRRVQLMEVCGTHTVSIFRSGLRSLLPVNVRLVSGPGCPVCVTAQRHIDAAIELAGEANVILATYGDMLRVPGRLGSLEQRRAAGASVQVVSSARGALQLARQRPDRTVVFLGVGFETTAPATAATVLEAERDGIENFVVLVSHKLVVPAMRALLEAGDVPLDGFLCPGHVSVIIGARAYSSVVADFQRPCVVAGFEPQQIMTGIEHLLRQIAGGRAALENVYSAVVSESGNPVAQELLRRVFIAADTPWRELGVIPRSGLEFAPAYRRFDAALRFGLTPGADHDHPDCRCGLVIQGKLDPPQCPLFGGECTPLRPVGPCMVSSEGTCAAWYRYARVVGNEREAALGPPGRRATAAPAATLTEGRT